MVLESTNISSKQPRSTWKLPLLSQHPLQHGENVLITQDHIETGTTNMLKYEQEMDPSVLTLVPLHKVNPGRITHRLVGISPKNSVEKSPDMDHDYCLLKTEPLDTLTDKEQIKMEEFSNLAPWAEETPITDEMNTTIFDTDEFNQFDTYSSPSLHDSHNSIKHKNNLYIDNCNLLDLNNGLLNEEKLFNIENNVSNYTTSDLRMENFNYNKVKFSNVGIPQCNVSGKMARSADNKLSFKDERYVSNLDLSDYALNNINFENMIKQPPLAALSDLNLNLSIPDNINTPEILDDIVDWENERFNFIPRVASNKNLSTVNLDDIKQETPSPSTSNPSSPQIPQSRLPSPSNQSYQKTESSHKRKRRKTDDDEDYVPPSRKSTRRKSRKVKYETDSDDDDYVKRPVGRPRRVSSVSSDCSKDSEGSKYRELRDKNNEASRRSRLKRKMKDHEMEEEADMLERRNVKLKAEVEELKRMVREYKSILLPKKD